MTDISSASATGLFDPFTLSWSGVVINMLRIPTNIFPEVVDCAGEFGVTPKEIFGVEIPIVCSVSCMDLRKAIVEVIQRHDNVI